MREVTDDPQQAAETAARKASLRRTVRAARDGLSQQARVAASAAVSGRLDVLPDVRRARTLLLYASFGSEVDVTAVATAARARGTIVCFPRVMGDQLIAVAATPLALRPGYRGIGEPEGAARPLDELDVVVLPGIAFDLVGGRLGQGGGHYDRLLARLPSHTVRIGAAHSCQLVPRVPQQLHDQPVDLVVTDRGVHTTGARDRPEGG